METVIKIVALAGVLAVGWAGGLIHAAYIISPKKKKFIDIMKHEREQVIKDLNCLLCDIELEFKETEKPITEKELLMKWFEAETKELNKSKIECFKCNIENMKGIENGGIYRDCGKHWQVYGFSDRLFGTAPEQDF